MKSIIKISGLLVVIVIFAFESRINAQPPEFNFPKEKGIPIFYYDVVTFAAEDSGKSLLLLYTKIAYDELQFVREEGQFKAEYELSITIFNQKGEQAESKILKKDIVVDSYEKTNSRADFSSSDAEFILLPGTYDLLIGIMDFDSKKTGRQKTKIIVPDYTAKSMDISDIVLADSVVTDSSGNIEYIPNVINNYRDKQKFMYLWFEIYSKLSFDSLKITYRISDQKGNVLRENVSYKNLKGIKTIEDIKIPRGKLKSGRYRLELVFERNGNIIKRSRDFTIHWIGMPGSASDLDSAVEQLRYIADGGEIKEMKKANKVKKEKLFKKFWRSKDPTPGTEENELMEEYYRRVEFCNTNFGTFMNGWMTDRGMVYIILGPPNDIERHPFEAGSKPYEIWSYYKINREFIFVDYTGFGEYRLVTPFWDVLNRAR